MRRAVAVGLLFTSVSSWASDYREEAVRSKASEYGDKVMSIWAPLGFTVGGGVALFGGGAWALSFGLLAAGLRGSGDVTTYDVLTACGGAVVAAGVALLTVGIVKFVLRSHRLRAQYGE